MREVEEVEIETEEVRNVVGTEGIVSSQNIQVRNQGRAKEMKKVSLLVSKGRVSLLLFYRKRSLNQIFRTLKACN